MMICELYSTDPDPPVIDRAIYSPWCSCHPDMERRLRLRLPAMLIDAVKMYVH